MPQGWNNTGAFRLQNEMLAINYLYKKKITRQGAAAEQAGDAANETVEQLRTRLNKQKQLQDGECG